MEIGDWITLGAVIVALGIGVASILHTRSLQQKERRERELNEILEWAIGISTCVFSVPYTMPLEDIKARQDENVLERIVRRHNLTTYTNLRLKYQTLAKKYIYFEHISHKYSEELSNSVKELSRQLNIIITNIQQCIKDVNRNKSENLESLKIDESELHKRADAVIEEATKIKTRDIG